MDSLKIPLIDVDQFDRNGQVKATGDLTIAGITHQVILIAAADSSVKGKITFAGQQEINLLDYDIDPPVALLGAIRTGNHITIEFTMTLNSKANLL